jgi:hypothetical protein
MVFSKTKGTYTCSLASLHLVVRHCRTASALSWLPVTLPVYLGSRLETEKLLWNAHRLWNIPSGGGAKNGKELKGADEYHGYTEA